MSIIIFFIIIYHFIINRKGKKTIMFIAFVSALILFGIGLGITSIGLTSFDIINETEKNEYFSQTKLSMHQCWNNMIDYICK